MDRLSPIFSRFRPTTTVFYAGQVCQQASFSKDDSFGHLHIMKSGSMRLAEDDENELVEINEPSVIFYPQPKDHQFIQSDQCPLDIVCASIDLGSTALNPISAALPDRLIIPLAAVETLQPLLDILFSEAFCNYCGRQAALDNLISYFLVILLRYLIEEQQCSTGLFAGLGDAKLAKAMVALHDNPQLNWNVESLADYAGMSRARFSEHFHSVVGITPMEYVTRWRISVAQQLLKQGMSIKQVAGKVGYQSAAAMTRVFSKRTGVSPREWAATVRTSGQESIPPTLTSYMPSLK
ncbi:AraC family transcriptional regulator [Aurantivibrio plasticivorans]